MRATVERGQHRGTRNLGRDALALGGIEGGRLIEEPGEEIMAETTGGSAGRRSSSASSARRSSTTTRDGTYNFSWGYHLNSLKRLCETGGGAPFDAPP